MEAYDIEKNWDDFSAARDHFFEIVKLMKSASALQSEHGEIEELLREEGFELLRKLLQGHLDLRSSKEELLESLRSAKGTMLTHRRTNCTRKLESIFGEVTVSRNGYGRRGHESVFPLDAELNLPQDKYSHGLHNVLGVESSKGSFDEAVSLISRMTGGAVPKRQAEEVTAKIAQDFDSFYENRMATEPQPKCSPDEFLVMSVDGKGIVMNEQSLREVTRKAAEKAEASRSKQSRLSPGEKNNRKRMATVAAIYSIAPHIRTSEQILHLDNSHSAPTTRPKPQHKRVWASVEKPMEEVVDDMFKEAHYRDPCRKQKWLVLVDGAPYQLKIVKRIAKQYHADVTIVLDFVHAAEYIWKAAYSFYDVGSDDAEQWVSEKLLDVLNGKAGLVAGAVGRKATKLRLTKKQRINVDRCVDYLKKLKPLMRYDACLKNGYPIATGVIEGACRYLIKDRMDITGARWGLERAEAVLKLRALNTSGDLAEYMTFHHTREHKRNYPASSCTSRANLKVVK